MSSSPRAKSSATTPEVCCICLNALVPGIPLLILSCSHKLHFDCLTLNIRANNKECPFCRAPVDASVARLLAKTSKARKMERPSIRSLLFPLPFNFSFNRDLPQIQTSRDDLSIGDEEIYFPIIRRTRPNYENLLPTLIFVIYLEKKYLYAYWMFAYIEDRTNESVMGFSFDRMTHGRQAATALPRTTNDPESVTVSTTLEYQAQISNEESNITGLITLEACRSETSLRNSSFNFDHKPIDLVCVVDQSRSMSGEKMVLLKNTLINIVQQMNESDRLAIIAFNTSARNISYGLRPMNRRNQKWLSVAIRTYISARSDTHIGCGLSMGIELLKNRKIINPLGALLLLTDGQDSQPHDYSQLIRTLPKGISCYTFGYGPDHNSLLLMDLAKQGNEGSFTYIDRIEALGSAFGIVLGGLFSCVAQQLRVNIKFNRRYLVTNIDSKYRYKPVQLPSATISIFLNDLNAGEKRNLVFKLHVPKIGDNDSRNSNVLICSTTFNHQPRISATMTDEFNRTNLSRHSSLTRTRKNIRRPRFFIQKPLRESIREAIDELELPDNSIIGYVSVTYLDLKSRCTVITTQVPFRLIRTLSPSTELLQLNHRVETVRVLEQAMAQEDYQQSRAILSEQAEKIQSSASAEDPFCQKLIEDLKYQHRSEQNYRLLHRASSTVYLSERDSYISNATRSAHVYLTTDQKRQASFDYHNYARINLYDP